MKIFPLHCELRQNTVFENDYSCFFFTKNNLFNAKDRDVFPE